MMSNRTEKRSKREDQKKMAVRVVCIALAVLLSLSAFVGLFGFFS